MVLYAASLSIPPPTTNTHLKTHPSLSLLSTCKTLNDIKQVHSQIIKVGLQNNPFALNKLVELSALSPFRNLSYAFFLFETIEEPNRVIWNNVIRALSISEFPLLAVEFYVRMILSGLEPNEYTLCFVFKACMGIDGGFEGKQIHGHGVKLGLVDNAFVGSSLIYMYAKIGELGNARLVFDKCCVRNVVSFTALITGYVSEGLVDEAKEVFDKMPDRDVVSWNAMIAGYAQCDRFWDALVLFEEMIGSNVVPNVSTLVTVLSACAHLGCVDVGRWIHSWILVYGLESDIRLVNALVDMYAKCGELEEAKKLFEGIECKNLISWNVMIGGYAYSSCHKEALDIFRRMLQSNVEPNDVTFLSVLPACASLGALDLGRWINAYIDKNVKNLSNSALWTSLIDMYSKCGDIETAEVIFNSINKKCVASWNAMICGYAMHGHANKALELFSEMTNKGYVPDDITYIGVLSACSHAGLVDLGRQHFHHMSQNLTISPKLQHHGCMIDLLSRAGLFNEAQNLISNMQMKPDAPILASLLAACRIHGSVELAEFYAKQLFEMEPDNTGAYVLLSNIYAKSNRWQDAANIRIKLNDKGIKKVPGGSSIELGSAIHVFVVGDKVHPQTKEIYEMLEIVNMFLDEAGFLPATLEML